MRHDKLEKELQLLLLLTENRGLTLQQIGKKLDISLRNIYYYLDFFRDAGFHLDKYGGYYSIDRSSPFFGKLTERISFTEEEAILISRMLNEAGTKDAIAETLKRKIQRFYDFGILANDGIMNEKISHNIGALHDAIKYERQVVLRGYSSPHSKTKRDRLVEPFMLMDGNREVRCYEPDSGMNKTFKIMRMDDVVPLSDSWQFKDRHKRMHTDAFFFSSDTWLNVELIMGQLSHDMLVEEYPRTANQIAREDDSHWRLKLDVCSYKGIGRFVLGLFDDITVVGDEGFCKYIKEKIASFATLANLDGNG